MRDSVRASFVSFNAPLEGKAEVMYLDILGLVTTAIGVMIDPLLLAKGLPWLHEDGTPASKDEIIAEWMRIKNAKYLAKEGLEGARKIATLHLSEEGIQGVVDSKLRTVEAILKQRFPEWDSWPADAQMGVLSMSWAMGPSFHFTNFEAACRARNWLQAARQCHMSDTNNRGLAPRNAENVVLFQNAFVVEWHGLDPETLQYPMDLYDA